MYLTFLPFISLRTFPFRRSQFSTEGVITLGSRLDENGRTVVDCQSDHLTPFAVLVDVSGALQVLY